MYLLYVDESGDTGLVNSPTRYFALSGIAIHESNWRAFVDHLSTFKKTMRAVYGLPMRTEIHASEYINSKILNLKRHQRLSILRNFVDEISKFNGISITNVIVDKNGKPAGYDVFDAAWKTLFQRFENTIRYGNFPGAHRADFGTIFTDNTSGKKLTSIVRKMSVYNPIPNISYYGLGYRNIPIVRVIEDPHGKDSKTSLIIQACDVCAYFLHQKYRPSGYIRKHGAHNYFGRLQPVLNTYASRANGLGIVVL